MNAKTILIRAKFTDSNTSYLTKSTAPNVDYDWNFSYKKHGNSKLTVLFELLEREERR